MFNIDYRIDEYKMAIDEFANRGIDCKYLYDAIKYITDDPKMSLVKSRMVLEKIVIDVYKLEMNQEPRKYEIGDTIKNNQFQKKLDIRIYKLIEAVRVISNMGSHENKHKEVDSEPTAYNAATTFENLLQIVKWYLDNYADKIKITSNKSKNTNVTDNNIDIQTRRQSINQTIINGQVSGVINSGNGIVNITNKK